MQLCTSDHLRVTDLYAGSWEDDKLWLCYRSYIIVNVALRFLFSRWEFILVYARESSYCPSIKNPLIKKIAADFPLFLNSLSRPTVELCPSATTDHGRWKNAVITR